MDVKRHCLSEKHDDPSSATEVRGVKQGTHNQLIFVALFWNQEKTSQVPQGRKNTGFGENARHLVTGTGLSSLTGLEAIPGTVDPGLKFEAITLPPLRDGKLQLARGV